MYNSLRRNNIIQTCLILTFAIASNATRFPDTRAAPTARPSTFSINARTPAFSDLTKAFRALEHRVKGQQGAYFESLADDNGTTMQELIVMNPDINDECSNLVAGNTYCVGQLGDDAKAVSTCCGLLFIRNQVQYSLQTKTLY